MNAPRHPWTSELVRAVVACLVALALAFCLVVPDSPASASPLRSDGLLTLSAHPAPSETSSDDKADGGVLLHLHCGCHQVMRAEPDTVELLRTADRIAYPVQAEPLASRSASPLRRPPRA